MLARSLARVPLTRRFRPRMIRTRQGSGGGGAGGNRGAHYGFIIG